MDDCKMQQNCLGHYVGKITPEVVVYIHLLPWYPLMDVFFLLAGKWVKVVSGRWDYCLDYDFALWWFLEGYDG